LNFVFLVLLTIFFSWARYTAAQQQLVAANVKASMASGVGRNEKISDAYEVALMYANTHYRLCASDVVSLKFPRAPEFDQTVSVEPDGVVNLAAVGDLRLEGLTTPESVQVIEAAYSKLLEDPTVVLELKDFNKPYFLVLGEVNRPGKYDLRGYTSASEALATAEDLRAQPSIRRFCCSAALSMTGTK